MGAIHTKDCLSKLYLSFCCLHFACIESKIRSEDDAVSALISLRKLGPEVHSIIKLNYICMIRIVLYCIDLVCNNVLIGCCIDFR